MQSAGEREPPSEPEADDGDEHTGLLSRRPGASDESTPQQNESSKQQPKVFRRVDEVLNTIGFGRFQYKLFGLCTLGGFFQSATTVNLSYFLPVLKDYWQLGGFQLALLSSSLHFGMGFGAFCLGWLGDRVGRRQIYLISMFLTSVFSLGSATCPEIYSFIACRFFVGFGFGAHRLAQVVLETEATPTPQRARMIALTEVSYGAGHLAGVVLAWGLMGLVGWRVILVLSAGPLLVLAIAYVFLMPSSPYWLYLQHRAREGEELLRSIAAENNKSDVVEGASFEILANTNAKPPSSSMLQLFDRRLIRVTMLLALVWIFSALATRLYIWVPLFLRADATEQHRSSAIWLNVYFSSALLALGELSGSLLLTLLVNPFDRRYLLGTGLVVLSLGSLILALARWPGLFFTMLAVVAILKFSMLNLLHVLTPELYPTSVRSSALGLFWLLHRLFLVAGHFCVVYLLKTLGYLLIFFSVSYAVAAVSTFFLPYDTRNRPLAETLESDSMQSLSARKLEASETSSKA